MINLNTNIQEIKKDLEEITSLFLPFTNSDLELSQDIFIFENSLKSIVRNGSTLFEESSEKQHTNDLNTKRQIKKFAKAALYRALKATLKVELPWGSITGVRPTKVSRHILETQNLNLEQLKTELMLSLNVSEEKANLVLLTLINQPKEVANDKLVDLYINIPFCPARCTYCSFISTVLKDDDNILNTYLDTLIYELTQVKEKIINNGYLVKNIYIGGGTPTVLNVRQLERLLSECAYNVSEFTVEAGRVDTITDEKFAIMKKLGVTRVSINPQSFNTKVLEKANRKISISKILETYKLALKYKFDINMDLIAGLDGDSFARFKKTIKTTLEFYPENISVHSLAIKKGSTLAIAGQDVTENKNIEKMISYAHKVLIENGYRPYYMYKLKNSFNGLENVGFCRDKKVCKFNIDSMEETTSIIAIGANAVSKRVYTSYDKIDRQFNPKDIKTYVEKVNELVAEKIKLFK